MRKHVKTLVNNNQVARCGASGWNFAGFETWLAYDTTWSAAICISEKIFGSIDIIIKSVTLHTDVGDIKIELYCEGCPRTCENFLALCASDYYKGCTFHRNIKGFIVQTGDPTQTGKGGSSIYGRKFEDEFKDEYKHMERGTVSMANNGPNTNGSQFFITYGPQPHLDLKYTVFGRVIDGFDALDELEKLAVNPKNYRPLTDTKINDVTIHANPLAN